MTQSGDGASGFFGVGVTHLELALPWESYISEGDDVGPAAIEGPRTVASTCSSRGMFNNVDGPTGKVWPVTNCGVCVTLPGDSLQQSHPVYVRVVRWPLLGMQHSYGH